MKKLLLIIFASICLLSFFPATTLATNSYESESEDPCAKADYNDPMLCGKKNTNEERELQWTVGGVISAIFGMLGVVAVIFVIIGGFKYTTSQGDPGKVQSAKNTIMFALIGLAVAISAFAITQFVMNALGSNGPGSGGSGSDITMLEITSGTTLGVNETMQIKVTIIPDYASDRSLTFSSSDKTVATIDDKGKILGKKKGQTTITAKASNGVSASIVLTVSEDVTTESIRVEPTEASIAVGGTIQIKATVTPKDANITWTSNNINVAKVDGNGLVTGVADGTAVITARVNTGEKPKKTITITVGTGVGGEAPTETYNAVFEKRSYTHSNGKTFEYWINIPEGATSNMPLVIFLHGDGEMNNANRVQNLGQVKHIKNSKDFIGIAPIGKGNWDINSNEVAVKGLIDKNVSDYKINKSRVYIWGFSRGGIGTWTFVSDYPGFFRAAVPVSGCSRSSSRDITWSNFKSTKVYALTGSKEDNINCMQSDVNKVTSAGGSAKFETVAGADHSSVTGKFPYAKVIDDWLLKQ